MNQFIKDVKKRLTREGWTVEHGGKHIKAKHPKGGQVIMAVSPSDVRAQLNILADIRRLKKSHGEAVV